MSKKDKIPSPCVDICEDKDGVCIACGRSEKDKHAWKKTETDEERLALIAKCIRKTEKIGTRIFWEREYRKKCRKKHALCPLDNLQHVLDAT